MSDKKKLCLVIPSLHAGGMERVMSELAEYFSLKPGLEVHLVMYGIKPELFYAVPSNIFIHKPAFVFNNKFRTWFTIKTLFYLRKEIKLLSPDSILSFGEYWNSFVLIALFGTKFKIFVSDRCQPDKSLGKLHDTLRRFLYPRAKGVIVQTAIAKEIYLEKLPGALLHTIGNPIRGIDKKESTITENIVLSVGRLIKTKHHDELIRLFVKINEPGWKLVIVGGNALKQKNLERLQALVNELHAEDKVLLTGSREDVDHFYQKSKIFAFTSSSEGFPNAVGEALSTGLPVIAFDCIAGPSDLISHDVNGLLIKLFDFDAFEVGLRKLIQDDSYRAKLASNTKTGMLRFAPEIIAESYLDFIL
ncbi:MAG: glycosyltransferase [Bacteroidota bacterium]